MPLRAATRGLPLAVALAGSGVALAQTPQHARAPLTVGPLVGGHDAVLEWRSGVPGALALLLLDGTAGPTPLPGLPAPALGVSPAAAVLPLATGPTGTIRFQIPTAAGAFASVAGSRFFAQGVAFAPNGAIVVSNAASTTFEPTPFAGAPFVPSAGDLPGGAEVYAGIFVRAADLDGDGHVDLVLSDGAGVALWRNDGHGSFTDGAFALPHPGDAVGALAVADVDDDGDVDVVTGGGAGFEVSVPDRLWRNDGAGVFTQDAAFPAGVGQSSDFGFGDFDLDGDLDLVVVNGPEGHIGPGGGVDRLYRNDGTGSFVEYDGFIADEWWNGDDDRSTSVAVGDVTGDGALDLFIAKNGLAGGGARNVLLVNLGDGRFADLTSALMPGAFDDRTAHATFVDLELDGDLDIVCANSVFSVPTSASNDVWINQGGGLFADDAASFLEPLHDAGIRLRVRAGDLDADGDPDVLVTTHDFFPASPQLLFWNQGGRQGGALGVFVRDVAFETSGYVAGDAAIFDADADGAAEAVLVANGVLGGDPAGELAVRYLRNVLP